MLQNIFRSASSAGRASWKSSRTSSLRPNTPKRLSRPSRLFYASITSSPGSWASRTSLFAVNLISKRYLATQSASQASPVKNTPSDAASVDFVSTALISMINKDNKVGKSDLRTALKQLKALEASSAAQVLKTVSLLRTFAPTASKPADTPETASLRVSNMGPILEESLARLVEVGFDETRLANIFLHLSLSYPEWRIDGWDNVIERYIINKGYNPQSVAFILGALPQDLIAEFQIRLLPNDVISQYYERWSREATAVGHHLGTHQSSRWPAAFYGSIFAKFYRTHDSLDEVALMVAHLASTAWIRSTPTSPLQPIEYLASSLYFAACVMASIVGHLKPMTNQTISSFLATFNAKIMQHLKENASLVSQGFNTFEYLEWASILIAETAKQRASKFNDIFLIKACLDKVLEKWGSDDVGIVSVAVGKRFSVAQWIRETVVEFKDSRKKA